jgi:hypothetical protein
LLPPRLREEFALSYGAAEQQAAQRLLRRLRRLYPYLPARLRHVGPYQEAEQRLVGSLHPDILTRISNRIWIGRPDLPKG